MNAKYKKSLKIVALLVTSLVIATASAASYSELFMYGTDIQIKAATVYFSEGGNTTLLCTTALPAAATEVDFDQVPDIEAGSTVIYEEAVNITNGASASKDVTIALDSLTGNFDTNFDYVNITMINANNVTQGNSIEIVSSASGSNVTTTGPATMADGDIWAVRWIIKAQTDATAAETFSITLKVTVQ
jgi:hypothetical protein